MDGLVVGWSAGRHVDHPYGGQISPWPARKVTDVIILSPMVAFWGRQNNSVTPKKRVSVTL